MTLTDLGPRPERLNELTDVRVTKVSQDLDFPGKGRDTVVRGRIDGTIAGFFFCIEGGSKLVRPNHFHCDE